jgi:hypothetical protein
MNKIYFIEDVEYQSQAFYNEYDELITMIENESGDLRSGHIEALLQYFGIEIVDGTDKSKEYFNSLCKSLYG